MCCQARAIPSISWSVLPSPDISTLVDKVMKKETLPLVRQTKTQTGSKIEGLTYLSVSMTLTFQRLIVMQKKNTVYNMNSLQDDSKFNVLTSCIQELLH